MKVMINPNPNLIIGGPEAGWGAYVQTAGCPEGARWASIRPVRRAPMGPAGVIIAK